MILQVLPFGKGIKHVLIRVSKPLTYISGSFATRNVIKLAWLVITIKNQVSSTPALWSRGRNFESQFKDRMTNTGFYHGFPQLLKAADG